MERGHPRIGLVADRRSAVLHLPDVGRFGIQAGRRVIVEPVEGVRDAVVAAWLQGRLAALQSETQVQLLGLGGLVRAVEVAAAGKEVTFRLPLSRVEYAGLLDRLAGLGSLFSLRRAPAPG